MMIGVFGYTIFENRDELFSSADSSKKLIGNPVGVAFTVSTNTKETLKALVNSNKNIEAIAVTSADLRLNIRRNVFFVSEKTVLVQGTDTETIPRLPLFSSSKENNRQVVKMINGEFFCTPYLETTLAKSQPGLLKETTTACRASLPPYYGFFSGFVTVFLKNDPTLEQQHVLRSEIEAIATEIYFKDVVPTSKRVP
jgi:hypothetical protein